MDTIAGEWIMRGCRENDSFCLHSPGDLLDLIREVGFLPLFSNDIPGFSVEERTQPAHWWTDDPLDPWAWRQRIAPDDGAAYGKFFDKKAGFVSKEWFPVFANFRRDGYDWEGMYQDGKMNARCKRILDKSLLFFRGWYTLYKRWDYSLPVSCGQGRYLLPCSRRGDTD